MIDKIKIIAIGFHKCGTSTIDQLFTSNGYNCRHGHGLCGTTTQKLLDIEKYQVVSDWCENHITREELVKIVSRYPDAYYILNTRPLESWILSRFKHFYYLQEQGRLHGRIMETQLFNPGDISFKSAQAYIHQRDEFYKNCTEIFTYRKHNFIVVDIYQPKFKQYINDQLTLNLNINESTHRFSTQTDSLLKLTTPVLEELYVEYSADQLANPLSCVDNTNNKLLQFPNNLP